MGPAGLKIELTGAPSSSAPSECSVEGGSLVSLGTSTTQRGSPTVLDSARSYEDNASTSKDFHIVSELIVSETI